MDLENAILKSYYDYMKEKSFFGENLLIVPKTPMSFSSFPTIILKETNNRDYLLGKSLNRQESVAQVTYTVEIYTKDLTYKNNKYVSQYIMNELKQLTYKFFNNIGFIRTSSARGEFMDITVDRNISIFESKINNWNGII